MDKITRRGALGGAAASLLIVKPETAFGFQANSALALGIIGTGNRGRYVGAIFAKDERVRVAAICDIQRSSLEAAKTQVPGADRARAYTDYRELLAGSDLDCILIATPIFLHPEHFEHAVGARKHIYCEKAAAADVTGTKRIMSSGDRADKTRHIQFGFQQRYGPEYLTAEKIIRSGQLGEMLLMRSHWMTRGQIKPSTRPTYASLAEEKLKNWYSWKETCGDFIVEQDCHGVDILNWYAKGRPLLATGAGGKKIRPYGDCNDHANITYEYANGLRGLLHGCQLAQGWSLVNEQFFGTEGTIETSRQYYRWYRAEAQRAGGQSGVEEVKSKREPTYDAVEYFLEHVITGKPENHTMEAAESTMTAMLGRMAVEMKRAVTWEEMMRAG
jgi:myo-inositol 2-dehydrogenase / D-chiro-inositol 1-dehydrogenase